MRHLFWGVLLILSLLFLKGGVQTGSSDSKKAATSLQNHIAQTLTKKNDERLAAIYRKIVETDPENEAAKKELEKINARLRMKQ